MVWKKQHHVTHNRWHITWSLLYRIQKLWKNNTWELPNLSLSHKSINHDLQWPEVCNFWHQRVKFIMFSDQRLLIRSGPSRIPDIPVTRFCALHTNIQRSITSIQPNPYEQHRKLIRNDSRSSNLSLCPLIIYLIARLFIQLIPHSIRSVNSFCYFSPHRL